MTSGPPTGDRWSGTPYAELHCHSNFSFLDGASHPEELVEEAVRLGLTALAVTDHDGFYGVVRFAEAAAAHGLPTVFGAELSLTAQTATAERGRAEDRRARRGPGSRIRPGDTCWRWPVARPATPGWPAPSPGRSCAAARRADPTTAPWSRSPPSCGTTYWC